MEIKTFNEINKLYKAFHISGEYSNKIKMTPRIPKKIMKDVNGDIIEDHTTPRVCFAPTIQHAIKAIFADYDMNLNIKTLLGALGHKNLLYAVKNNSNLVKISDNKSNCPSCHGNKYNIDFNWKKYCEKNNINYHNSDKLLAKLVKGCVPDADITGELWALKPIEVEFIGILDKENLNVLVISKKTNDLLLDFKNLKNLEKSNELNNLGDNALWIIINELETRGYNYKYLEKEV